MLFIKQENTNPYYNIASEEYFLKNFNDDVFILYRNEPSVIIGKHQNPFSEINYKYLKSNNIQIVRRLSGGGAVYHDLGNINFTFIKNKHNNNLIDFEFHIKPIYEFLRKLKLNVSYGKRHDLFINDMKISGNAEHIWKKRVLHHGTLLFNSDLNQLSNVLFNLSNNYEDKAIKSVISKVTNIVDFLDNIKITDLFNLVFEYVSLNSDNNSKMYEITKFDNLSISKLIENKYNNWKWNFGYSPKYFFLKEFVINGIKLNVSIDVENGIIKDIKIITNNFFSFYKDIEKLLKDIPHEEKSILEILTKSFNQDTNKKKLDINLFVSNLF